MLHLDRLRLWGKVIQVAQSRHSSVQLPRDGQQDAGLTKEYSSSPLHRFKKPGSKNFQVNCSDFIITNMEIWVFDPTSDAIF